MPLQDQLEQQRFQISRTATLEQSAMDLKKPHLSHRLRQPLKILGRVKM